MYYRVSEGNGACRSDAFCTRRNRCALAVCCVAINAVRFCRWVSTPCSFFKGAILISRHRKTTFPLYSAWPSHIRYWSRRRALGTNWNGCPRWVCRLVGDATPPTPIVFQYTVWIGGEESERGNWNLNRLHASVWTPPLPPVPRNITLHQPSPSTAFRFGRTFSCNCRPRRGCPFVAIYR